MEPKKVITLCPACGACPTVELYDDTVRIGEEGASRLGKRNGMILWIKSHEVSWVDSDPATDRSQHQGGPCSMSIPTKVLNRVPIFFSLHTRNYGLLLGKI